MLPGKKGDIQATVAKKKGTLLHLIETMLLLKKQNFHQPFSLVVYFFFLRKRRQTRFFSNFCFDFVHEN